MRRQRAYVVRRRWAASLILAALAAGVGLLAVAQGQGRTRSAEDRASPQRPGASGGPVSPPVPRASPFPPTPSPIPGYILIADRGNNRILLVNSNRVLLWRYPQPGQSPTFPFRFDDDAFFSPQYRSIISQQEFQQTIQVISFPAGNVVWHYGHPNVAGSAPGYLNTPDDAYLLPSGIREVADIRNCRILLISPAHRIVRQLGTTGACYHNPPAAFASPNGDTPIPGGGTLVSEIGGSWIDAISNSGRLLWSVHAPVVYPSDAQWLGNGRILLADYSDPGAILIMTRRGKVLWRYGPTSGPGMLDHPSLALMLPNGLVAVNDDFRDRVVLISVRTHRIVWQYGHTDVPGVASGYLNTPDGIDFLPFRVAIGDRAIWNLVRGG